ncbi:N-carbamoylputrescine amidase [Humidesulfovibrio mexicanus]|uniref:N-carbamoylputrescine amidase n=1 Tax=Humidesulfovibrio mexicanus TaxID=147047 RepID=A0A239CT41_9BACT|nr:carbon-nitrogen hydrolase [Humidesulfovibrio mexicanus]SNS23416.1 N-carbamoylputrescine amidase [Humidesulfovibrio mexicanus]
MSRTPYTIALVQTACRDSAQENLQANLELAERAAGLGADVVCLQELFKGPYFCQQEDARLFDLAEPVPGPTTEAFGTLAKKTGAAMVVSLFEKRAIGLYHNTAAVIGREGNVLGVYRKMHIPDDPAFYEKFYFTPGDLGFLAVDTHVGRIGVCVCWDQWYPEAARLTALKGAEVIFYPTAIGWHPQEKAQLGQEQRDAWMLVQRGHAVANGCYIAAANRIGLERPLLDGNNAAGAGIEFWGTSFVAGPAGELVAQAPTDEETILLARVDPGRMEDVRRGWPFLRDRRTDAYQNIVKRFDD